MTSLALLSLKRRLTYDEELGQEITLLAGQLNALPSTVAIEAVATPLQLENQQALQDTKKSVSAETSTNTLRHPAPNVDSKTCIPHWRGESCDYGMAVGALQQRDGSIESN